MGCLCHRPTNLKPNSGVNWSDCVGDSGVTGHVLRDRCHDEAIQIINEASAHHRLRGMSAWSDVMEMTKPAAINKDRRRCLDIRSP